MTWWKFLNAPAAFHTSWLCNCVAKYDLLPNWINSWANYLVQISVLCARAGVIYRLLFEWERHETKETALESSWIFLYAPGTQRADCECHLRGQCCIAKTWSGFYCSVIKLADLKYFLAKSLSFIIQFYTDIINFQNCGQVKCQTKISIDWVLFTATRFKSQYSACARMYLSLPRHDVSQAASLAIIVAIAISNQRHDPPAH